MNPLISHDHESRDSVRLSAADVEPFLRYLFSTVAVRPEKVNLRETAAAVRYLDWLALSGVPRRICIEGTEAVHQYRTGLDRDDKIRDEIRFFADALWGLLRQTGSHQPATSGEAQALLRKHSAFIGTFPYFDDVVNAMETFQIPAGEPLPPTAVLVSPTMTSVVPIPRQAKDDLSERIWVGSVILGESGVRRVNVRISKALQSAGLKRDRHDTAGSLEWARENVRERIKAYEKALVAKWGKEVPFRDGRERRERLLSFRRILAQRWIGRFRHWQSYTR